MAKSLIKALYHTYYMGRMLMSKVIEAVYERGVFRPLEEVGLKEGEKVKIIILVGEEFYDLVERLEVEAKEDIDRVMDEVRGRARRSS